MTPTTDVTVPRRHPLVSWPLRLAQFAPPLVAALFIAGITIPGSSLWPYNPNMIDLDVYRRTGDLLLTGGDIYHAEGLPWIYPGFAALFTVPLAALPLQAARVLWLALCVLALGAMLRRLGESGWRLSLLTTGAVLLVEPVRETIGFGQLGILLCAAAVLDSMPGRRFLSRRDGRRYLPEGWLVGLATAVKLVPAVVAMHNFFAGRRREGLVAFAAFCLFTAVGFLVLPQQSLYYWVNLAGGNSGINNGIIFKTNQSVMGAWARLTGSPSGGGLILGVAVVVLGVAASVALHKAGRVRLGLSVAGLTSLLASPISWSHHFVWVIPLAYVFWYAKDVAGWLRWPALVYALWVVVAPFRLLPGGEGAELRYTAWQQAVANAGVALGLGVLVLSLVYGVVTVRRHGVQDPAPMG